MRERRIVMLTVIALSLSVTTNVAANEPSADVNYMGHLVYEAKRAGRLYPDFYRINPGLGDRHLYAVQKNYVQRQLAEGDSIAGFKGGFIPQAPVGGVVLGAGVLRSGTTTRLADFRLLVIEAEFAFRFCAAVNTPLVDVAALKKAVCEIAPALEVADGALPDFAEVKADFVHLRKALIPLNVAYSKVVFGDPVATVGLDLDSIPVSMSHNGVEIGVRDLDQVADLWSKVLWIVNDFALAEGYPIRAGHFIIPGNQTGIHIGMAGHYRANFGALGQVELQVAP